MFVGEMFVGEMLVGEMFVGEMFVGEFSVDKMQVDKMTWCQKTLRSNKKVSFELKHIRRDKKPKLNIVKL
jgi:hypothetical protein